MNMKRAISILLLICLCGGALSGCSWLDSLFYPEADPLDFGSNDKVVLPSGDYEPLYGIDGERIADAPLTAAELRAKSIHSDNLTADRIADGTLYAGNLIRLARALKRADAAFIIPEGEPYFSNEGESSSASSSSGEPVDTSPLTVAFVGSGTAAGAGVEFMKNAYPFVIRRWFADTYGSDNLNVIFGGVAGTDSMYGAHTVTRDILSQQPDIVFVDYALSDLGNPYAEESFESLVRTLLADPCGCAVVILCTMNSACTGSYDSELNAARAYGLPVISMLHSVRKELSAGEFFFSSYTDDGFSLGLAGHAFFGDLCANFLENVRRALGGIDTAADIPLPASTLTAARFVGGSSIINTKRPKSFGSFARYGLFYDIFGQTGWEATKPGAPMVFTVQAQYISVMYWRVTDRTGGRISVSVDGAPAELLECDYIDGDGDSAAIAVVFTGDAVAEHTVEIAMSEEKNNGSTGERVCVLSLMTS